MVTCSVLGCVSAYSLLSVFKLPREPKNKREWMQFLFKSNGENFQWSDKTTHICSAHFTDECFVNSGCLRLKSDAVPSIFLGENRHEKLLVKTTDIGCQCDSPETRDSSTHYFKEPTSKAIQVNLVQGVSVSCTTEDLHDRRSDYSHDHPDEIDQERFPSLQMGAKYVINEDRILQLFRRTCPVCSSSCSIEKIVHGTLLIVNQQCHHCDHKNQWRSQPLIANVPAGNQTQTMMPLPLEDSDGCCDNLNDTPTLVFETSLHLSDNENSTALTDNESLSSEEEEEEEEEESTDEWHQSEEQNNTDSESAEDLDSSDAKLHRQLCQDCGKFIVASESNNGKTHVCEHKKMYPCLDCGKRWATLASLKRHNRIHQESYVHSCKFCLKPFKTRPHKLSHEESHPREKCPYQCPDCPERFSDIKLRDNHLQSHRGSKRHICKDCNKEFLNFNAIQRHNMIHTGEKPHMCQVCQRSFKQASHLKSHMRLHTGERPFKCQKCDRSFNHNVSLKSHVQSYHGPGSNFKKQGESQEPNSGTEQERVEVKRRKRKRQSSQRQIDPEDSEEEGARKNNSDLTVTQTTEWGKRGINRRATRRGRGRPRVTE